MYDRIETELWGVEQTLQPNHAVSTISGEPEWGDDPTQIHHLDDVV